MNRKPQSAEIIPGPGFRIKQLIARLDKDLIDVFGQFETPDISDVLNRLYTMSPHIKNVSNSSPLVGSACTVKLFPGDNLMVHKALDIAQPGDVIVVDTSYSNNHAVLGDLIACKAKHRGIGGFIIDGLVRDLPGLKELNLPIYARGVTPLGPLHRGPGEINFPVSCGGVVIMPGDIVVADTCGIVVIRQEFAEEILKQLTLRRESLQHYISSVNKGIFSNDWVDNILKEANCLVRE